MGSGDRARDAKLSGFTKVVFEFALKVCFENVNWENRHGIQNQKMTDQYT